MRTAWQTEWNTGAGGVISAKMQGFRVAICRYVNGLEQSGQKDKKRTHGTLADISLNSAAWAS